MSTLRLGVLNGAHADSKAFWVSFSGSCLKTPKWVSRPRFPEGCFEKTVFMSGFRVKGAAYEEDCVDCVAKTWKLGEGGLRDMSYINILSRLISAMS